MRIRGVDFPESLLAAQKNRTLVIFAGAGASMPPPSNYPNFAELARQVANGVLTQEDGEPMDRFLGRLRDKGLKIHDLVAEILNDPKSQINSLHRDILRLFRSPSLVRLVTTNFDSHFTQAAIELFGSNKSCEVYFAPALPLGDSFEGIVHLHGCVDKAAERLVLTDADFGRAYLTEGWARIFLQRLFGHYTVLFIGYSHDDSVMNYLARGLPPQFGAPQRFALSPAGNEERWKSLGITAISYHLTDDENKHSILSTALGAWAIQAQQGALDQEQRIKSIVELPPPLDLEATDYVKASLSEENTTRFFTRHAKSVEWLKWVEDQGFLKNLFRVESSITAVDGLLASWFAESFVLDHAGAALSVIRRQGQLLHPFLWTKIVHRLFRKEQGRWHDPGVLRRWIAVLISRRSPETSPQLLSVMLGGIYRSEDRILAIILFEYLTRPIVRLENNFWSEREEINDGEDVRSEIIVLGEGYWLADVWQRFLLPRLSSVVDALESIITSHLQQAFFLSHIGTEPDEGMLDRVNLSRYQIEQSAQSSQRDGIHVLIDAGYELMKWNNSNRHSRADALINQWFSSPSFLLKRLAIIGVAENAHWTADQKLSWLLDNKLIYAIGLKYEVFQVLKNSFRASSEASKKSIINEAKQGHSTEAVELSSRTRSYEIYNLLYWLHTEAPDSELASAEFETIQKLHPDFGKRTRPELDVEISPVMVGVQSPITSDKLLAKSAAGQIDWLISFAPQHPMGPNRAGLGDAIREASVCNHEWGLDLARSLAKRRLWDSDLWLPIILAWTQATLNSVQWIEMLTFLRENQSVFPTIQHEIARLLEEGSKGVLPPIPDEAIELAVDISKKLWAISITDKQIPSGMAEQEWLFTAINHPAGKLAIFWLNVLSKERKNSGQEWRGLPVGTKQLFDTVLSGDSYASALARVIFASQLTFLHSLDEAWTQKSVIPLFDWSIDGQRASQAFHGFLVWGRQTEDLLPHLVPLYVKAFSHMAELGKSRDRYCEYLAALACLSSINPLENGWLNQFLLVSELRDRITWATFVRQILKGMSNEARRVPWDIWMREYWQRRLHGVPVPLDQVELGEMVEWTQYLGTAFPEVVEKISLGPAFQLKNSFIYRELAAESIPETYPSKTGDLLVVLLRNETNVLYDLDQVDAIVRLIMPAGVSKSVLLVICNELARLGYENAGRLRDFVDANSQR